MQIEDTHIAEDVLERLAAGHKMKQCELESIAAHFLNCEHCQQRYEEWEEFVTVFRSVIVRIDY